MTSEEYEAQMTARFNANTFSANAIPPLPFPMRRIAGLPAQEKPCAIGRWLEQKTRNGDLSRLPLRELNWLREAAALLEATESAKPRAFGPWPWSRRK